MRILGLDPGSERFGYGVIDVAARAAAAVYVAAGVCSAPAGWDKYRRLAEIGKDIDALLDEYLPDAVAIEGGFVFGQQGAMTLGAARGVGGFLAARRGLPVLEYQPTTVKKAITGAGSSKKPAVAAVVCARLGLKATPEPDAADALAVAITGIGDAFARVPVIR